MTDPRAQPGTEARTTRSKAAVRPSQVRRHGIAKLTEVAAILLDAGFDDLVEVNGGWMPGRAAVVRANVVDQWVPARLGEVLDVAVACGGLARHWVELRASARGSDGAHVVVSTSWVVVDVATGRPAPLPDAVVEGYAAAGRRPRPVPRIGPPPGQGVRRPWPVRADDLDANGHVNNAAYLSVVAEVLERDPVPTPHRVEVVYRSELTWPAVPDLVTVDAGSRDRSAPLEVWLVGDGGVHAAMRITPLDPAQRPVASGEPGEPTG